MWGGNTITKDNDQVINETEAIITQVQGVVSGRIVSRDNEILEIHVLADGTRSPKQIVRDIESAVLVKVGLELDHKKISVAQLDPELAVPAETGVRFLFQGISYSSVNGNTAVEITIGTGNQSYTAEISGPNNSQNRIRLTASATLSAVENSMGVEGMLTVNDVQKIHLGGNSAIAAAICLKLNNHEETLLGTALNKGDDLESTVRASLDAVNRRLTFIKSN